MGIFWILALNISSLIIIGAMIQENGVPQEQGTLLILGLFIVNAIANIYHTVSSAIPQKKEEPKEKLSGTFIPNHDVKEVHTIRRCDS